MSQSTTAPALTEAESPTHGGAQSPPGSVADILGARPDATAEAILGPRPSANAIGRPDGGALWAGPEADEFYAAAQPIARVLDAFGQGAAEAWDSGKDLGFSDEINAFMRKAGIYNDVSKGQGSWLRTFNEAMIRPTVAGTFGLGGAAFRGMAAGFTGAFRAAGQTAEEAGQPILGRDITALPEAFPLFGHELGIPNLPLIPTRADIQDVRTGVRLAAENARSAAAGFAMRTGPLAVSEVDEAARLGVIGPLGRAGWDGTAVYPVDHFPAGATVRFGGPVDATQEAIPARFELEPPRDIHEAARRVAPEVFDEYDGAMQQRDALRARIDAEAAALRQNAEAQAPHAAEIADLQDRMETATPRLAKKYQARLNAMIPAHNDFLADQFTIGALTRDTEEITAARQQIQELDYKMRDLAPQVTEAYRVAAERYPETQPPAEPEPVAAAAPAPPTAETAPAAAPATPQASPAAEAPQQPRPAGATPPGTEAPAFSIAEDVSHKLVAAGRPQAEAEAAAQLIAAHYAARAARFGGQKGTAEDLYRSEAPDIRGAATPKPKPAGLPRIRTLAEIQAEDKVSARKAQQIQNEEIVARGRPVEPIRYAEPAPARELETVGAVEAPHPPTTPGATSDAEQQALQAAIARAQAVTPDQSAARLAALEARRAQRRNPALTRLAEAAGVGADATPEAVAEAIVERLPAERVAEERNAEVEAGETEYREAERAAKEADPAFDPAKTYDADQSRDLEELENEHRPPDNAAAPEQRAGGGGEREPTGAGEGPLPEGGESPGRGAEPGRRDATKDREPTAVTDRNAGRDANPAEGGGRAGPVPVVSAGRRLDSHGNPIFAKGERVVIPEGEGLGGRHGEVEEAVGLSFRPIFGGATSEPAYSYTVRTDGGALAHATRLEAETGEAPRSVPDPRYEGHAIDPAALQRIITARMATAASMTAREGRARTPKMKAEWRRDAQAARDSAAAQRAVLDQWAAEHPEEADRVLPERRVATTRPTPDASPAAEPDHLTKMRDALEKRGLRDDIAELYRRRLSANPDRWASGAGVSYEVASGGGRPQINRGFRVIEVSPKDKMALVRSVADTGLTVTGGDRDAINDEWQYLGDLRRDHKYDAATAGPANAERRNPPSSSPAFSLVETRHTKTGAPLFVVTVAGRVPEADFAAMRGEAKQSGGYYSSFRGHGAVPGWTFKTREAAETFMRGRAGAEVAAPPSAGAVPIEAPGWREIGQNAEGNAVFEDGRGVRSVVRGGARLAEPVTLRPTRAGMEIAVDRTRRSGEFVTAEEAAPAPTLEEVAGEAAQQGPPIAQTVADPANPVPPLPNALALQESGHFAAGWAARRDGKTRDLPSYFTRRTHNSRAWQRGWDAANKAALTPQARTVADALAPADGKGPLPVTGGPATPMPHGAMREAGWKGGNDEPAPATERPRGGPSRPENAERPADWGANNRLVTREDAEAIRARLREKRSQLRAGIDPEMMLDGARLAVFHIEAGARAFADYAREMTQDIGEEFRPYLRSWYEAARHWPGMDAREMSRAAEIDAETARWTAPEGGALSKADGTRLYNAYRGDPMLQDIGQQIADGRTVDEIANSPVGVKLSNAEIVGLVDQLEERGEVPEPTEPEEADHGIQGAVPVRDEGAGAEDVHGVAPGGEVGRAPTGEERGGAPAAAGASGEQAKGQVGAAQPGGRTPGRGNRPAPTDRIPGAGEGPEPGATGRFADRPDARVEGTNFAIEPADLAEGRGQKQKARDNVAAIELAKKLTAEDRAATKAEQAVLVRYTGWGGIKNAFEGSDGKFGTGFEEIGGRLKAALTAEEYRTAAQSTQYAHYTAEHVVRSMWDAVRRMGFDGGLVFEPGMGIGHFLGLMPGDLAEKSQYQGIERDHLTADIAKLLYPQSGVRQADYIRTPMPEGAFDLVIGNPPFSDTVITADPKYAARKFMLHDYFFAKSLDSVRPGGLLAFITSAGTMNKIDTAAREYLAGRAELVGGIRLPNTAFRRNAGTEVTTDILFFKKLADPREERPAWTETVQRTLPNVKGGEQEVNVSRYFSEHPENVLGTEAFGDMMASGRYEVQQVPGSDLEADLRAAVQRLPENVMDAPLSQETRATLDFESGQKKDGSFYIADDGRLMQYRDGAGRDVPKRGAGTGGFTAAEHERIRHLVPMRDALRDVFSADLARDDAAGANARGLLNEHYDRFVDKFGPVNKAEFRYQRPTLAQQEAARLEAREEARAADEYFDDGDFDPSAMLRAKAKVTEIAKARQMAREEAQRSGRAFNEGTFDPADMPDNVYEQRPNIKPFMSDPESYRLRSIESYNDATGQASKKRVFYESILKHEEEPEIRSANDGVLWSMNKLGRFDLDAIAKKMGRDPADVVQELGDSVYKVPGTRDAYQTKDEYLSGDVVSKLETARAEAESDPDVRRNIPALEAALPPPLPPSEISMVLGMPWIPNATVREFVRDRLNIGEPRIVHSGLTGTWHINAEGLEQTPGYAQWGVEKRNAFELLSDAMNRTPPRIYDEYYEAGTKVRVFDQIATQGAQDNVDAIKAAFAEWVTGNTDRADGLAQLYNDRLNRTVLRQYDGSYMTTPGVASTWQWRPHQTRVVSRIVQSGNTYMAHAVGAGKTSAMIGAGMEMRRLGLVRKPLYIVPNHMLGQFTKEFYEQYPTARIAVADEDRFHTDRRRQFVANVAQDDLDAVIMTHSSFVKIPISDGFQEHLVREQIDMLDDAMGELDPQADRITRGRIEEQKEKLEQKLSKQGRPDQDQALTFEELGADFLFVDEAHQFRKLSLATKQGNLKGITPKGSNMAWDLYSKVRYLDSQKPGRSAVFASGTPVTNTMGELYSLSRFMQPEALKERGLSHFDSWAQTFGDTKTGLEETAAGTYQPVTRFGQFVNLPELYKMVGEVMDIVTPQQLEQYVTRPKLQTGARQFHLAPRTEMLDRYQAELAGRMDAIKARKGPPKKGDDILLSVINDGRHAAIDPRFIEQAQSDPHSKLNMMVANVARIYHETADHQFYDPASGYEKESFRGPATQMIFANLGVNGRGPMGFSGYQWIKEALRREGVAPEHIAFIGDYGGALAKQALFNDMNEGKIRVLVGSTQKMGTGVNAQRRLIAIHNQDPLWFPADDEQRVGRALRQGNHNPEIAIHDYSTKGTYDSAMWKMMGNKARFIEQFFRGDPNLRNMEDLGEASMYEQASAMATTDERIITLTQMKQDLDRAHRREAAHDRDQYSLRQQLKQKQAAAAHYTGVAASERDNIARREDTAGDKFSMMVGGAKLTKRSEAAEALDAEIADRGAGLGKGVDTVIGRIGGFPLVMWRSSVDGELHFALRGSGGNDISLNSSRGTGLIASAEAGLRKFENSLSYAQQQHAAALQAAENIRALIGTQFTGGAEIDRLSLAVRDLEGQLKREAAAKDAPPTTDEAGRPDASAAEETGATNQTAGESTPTFGAPGEEQGRTLYQRAQGKINIGDARTVITLMKDANASTFLHETGHAWLEELLSDAKDHRAPPDLIADATTVRRWLGAEADAPITTRQHEKFARGFERYMMEGVAPSRGLARVFAQFKSWLTAIYQTVTRLRSPINDDIRRVFDRLVSVDADRTVVAPESAEAPRPVSTPEVGAKVAADLAALHESDAEHTPAHEAATAAAQTRGERDKTIETHAPEVADELTGRRPGEEAGGGRESAPGSAGNGRRAGQPPGEGGDAARSGEERGGGSGVVAQGNRSRGGARPEQPGSPHAPTEEPSELVDKAGNIRLDNLNESEDVKRVLRDLAKEHDDFIVARGGVIPDVQRRAMADALGLTVENFDPKKPDGVSPSVWADAVQKLTFQASDEAARLGSIFGDSGSPQDGAAYLAAKQRLLMIADHFSTLTAEAGRTLRVFDKAGMSFTGDMVARMERDTGRTLYQLQQEARAVGALDTTAKRSKMMQDTRELTRGELVKRGIIAYFINNLISGPITHAGYSIGNAVWATFKATALTAAEATLDATRVAFGADPADRVYYGEIGAQIYGMLHGVRDGIVPGWKAFQTGISYMEGAERIEAQNRGAATVAGTSPLGEAALRAATVGPALEALKVPGRIAAPVGHVLETPSRAVSAIHTLFYAMNYEREIARLAFRAAANDRLVGMDFSTRVAELTQNPPPEMVEAAHDEAIQAVLMKRPPYGSSQYHLAAAINQSLPAKIVMPFMQIGMNILSEGLIKSTPIGLASQAVRDNLAGRNGEVARSQQYARIMVGSGVAAGVMGLAAQGILTGGGPTDRRELALKEATGWKAYSIRIGDTYVPYRKYLGPLGPLVGAAANIYDVAALASEGEVGKAIGSAALGFTEVVANETWMTGLSSLIDATRHWDTQGEKYLRNLALDFMPFSVGLGQSARLIDQYQREVHSWTDALRNKLPGLSQGLYPQRDWTGAEIASHTMMSPSVDRHDPTMAQMQAVEFFPAKLPREIRGVPLTDRQYDEYARVAGHLAKMRMDALVRALGFTDQPAGYQQKMMAEVLSGSRKAGEDYVMMQPENAGILRQSMTAKAAQMQGRTAAEVRGIRREPAAVTP